MIHQHCRQVPKIDGIYLYISLESEGDFQFTTSPKSFKREANFFQYFAFFLMRKAASHMIFSFPELLKYCQPLFEMSRDQEQHHQNHMTAGI